MKNKFVIMLRVYIIIYNSYIQRDFFYHGSGFVLESIITV